MYLIFLNTHKININVEKYTNTQIQSMWNKKCIKVQQTHRYIGKYNDRCENETFIPTRHYTDFMT